MSVRVADVRRRQQRTWRHRDGVDEQHYALPVASAAVAEAASLLHRETARQRVAASSRRSMSSQPPEPRLRRRTYASLHTQLDARECSQRTKLYRTAEPRSSQPCIPPGSLSRVPASAGVRAGMSPLPGGMWIPVAVWQPCELLYTCYLLTSSRVVTHCPRSRAVKHECAKMTPVFTARQHGCMKWIHCLSTWSVNTSFIQTLVNTACQHGLCSLTGTVCQHGPCQQDDCWKNVVRCVLMFCCCFFSNDFCQPNFLNIYQTYVHQICRVDRTMAVDKRREVSFWSIKGRCRGNQFCGPNQAKTTQLWFAWHSLGWRTTRSAIAA